MDPLGISSLFIDNDARMSRPKFFRDPLHIQLRFESVDLSVGAPGIPGAERRSWLLRKLIDCREFQRLRFVRQNGLANLVFHGAEHSRFSHSLGVMHLASEMYGRIVRNMGEIVDENWLLGVCTAALLHDIGHGPFSHTIEDILDAFDVEFDHEHLTARYMEDETSPIRAILHEVDSELPAFLSAFIIKSRRKEDHWAYKLVSSQLDADRLDYLMRDSMFAGLKGHGFDLPRILDLLSHHENSLAVERGAMEAVEAYLITLDQRYRSIYYHHTVRAANFVLTSALRRAVELYKNGDKNVFPRMPDGQAHPFAELVEKGEKISLETYTRLGEQHIWVLLDMWSHWKDEILKDLSQRMLTRNLFKTQDVEPKKVKEFQKELKAREDSVIKKIPYVTAKTVDYYVSVDQPERTSYKLYDWRPESQAESIWITKKGDSPAMPIENVEESTLIRALKGTRYFPRIIFPAEGQ